MSKSSLILNVSPVELSLVLFSLLRMKVEIVSHVHKHILILQKTIFTYINIC